MRTEIVIPFAFDTAPLEQMLQEQGEEEVMNILTNLVTDNVISKIPHKAKYSGFYSNGTEPDWAEFLASRFNRWLDSHADDIIDEAALLLVQKGSRKKKWREVLAEVKAERGTDVRFTLKDGLDPEVYAPKRAHSTDAGADIKTPYDVTVPAHGSVSIDTGVHIELPKGTAGLLVSKSGLNVIFGMTSTGLIDEGFTGEIRVRVYNHTDADYVFKAGNKITQIVVIPVNYANYVYSESIDGGERGDDGYGSTGK